MLRLVEELAKYCEDDLKDIWLPTKPLDEDGYDEDDFSFDEKTGTPDERKAPYRPIRAYTHAIPPGADPDSRIPYVLVQLLGGEDKEDRRAGRTESIAEVRMILALYDEDTKEGRRAVINIISKLRNDLQSKGVLGCYEITEPFRFQVLSDDTGLYHIGEIATVWKIPGIQRDIPYLRP